MKSNPLPHHFLDQTVFVEDCLTTMSSMPDNCIDLTVTSPPYDGLRIYDGFSFDFPSIAGELYRVTKVGGVVVWVVGDSTVNGSESGTSFRQALHFKDIGFNLHDTMIYSKASLPKNHNRYEQDFEYMFVLSKGRPKTFNPIKIPTLYPENETARQNSYFSETGEVKRSARSLNKRKPVGTEKIKGNIWRYNVGYKKSTLDDIAFKHPAIFPEQLAYDHIVSWSNEGDVVFDPFLGSGTTGKMAIRTNRLFVGCEISSKYADIATERMRLERQQEEPK